MLITFGASPGRVWQPLGITPGPQRCGQSWKFHATVSDLTQNKNQTQDSRMNSFHVLDISSAASEAEIKAAYRRLALVYHPDKAGPESKAKFQAIQAAYEQALSTATSSWCAKSSSYTTRTTTTFNGSWGSQAYKDFQRSRASQPSDRRWAGSFRRSYAQPESSFRSGYSSSHDKPHRSGPQSAAHSDGTEHKMHGRRNAFSAAGAKEPRSNINFGADASLFWNQLNDVSQGQSYMRCNAFSEAGADEPLPAQEH